MLYKKDFVSESYTNIDNFWFRKALSRFRFGMTELRDSFLKFEKGATLIDRTCPLCKNCNEDEMHFLLICPKYEFLRLKLLPIHIYNRTFVQFIHIMSNQSLELNVKLAEYVYKALSHRQKMLIANDQNQ